MEANKYHRNCMTVMAQELRLKNAWGEKASHVELTALRATAIALGDKHELLTFLLDPQNPELAAPIEVIKKEMKRFSEEEQALIELVMGFWSEGFENDEFKKNFYKLLDKLSITSLFRFERALFVFIGLPSTEEEITESLSVGRPSREVGMHQTMR